MFDFEAVTTFVAVVRSSGFRGAATSMRIPRSTVSHRIARLEDELAVRLIERTTRKLRMTAVGEAVLDRCLRVLADVEEAQLSGTNAERAPHGTLRAACSLLFGHLYMGRIAADFIRQYPRRRSTSWPQQARQSDRGGVRPSGGSHGRPRGLEHGGAEANPLRGAPLCQPCVGGRTCSRWGAQRHAQGEGGEGSGDTGGEPTEALRLLPAEATAHSRLGALSNAMPLYHSGPRLSRSG
jgi:Bacterial regulatory helix-turn-helix protein, lysR family